MSAETGPIGGDLATNSLFWRTPAKAGLLPQRLLDMPVPGEDVDFDGDLEPIVRQRTALYAATSDVHDQARFETEVPQDKRLSARGIEWGRFFITARNIPRR